MAANETSLSAGALICDILNDDAAVSAITTHVFPVATDQAVLPCIIYRRASFTATQVKSGRPSDTVTIDVLCCARTYPQSIALAEAVRSALDGVQAVGHGLNMRSCELIASDEAWQNDAYTQLLTFNCQIM